MIFPKGKSGAIAIYDSVISDEDCDFIVDSFESLSTYHFEGKTVGGTDRKVKKTTDLHVVTNGNLSNYTQEQIDLMAQLDKIIFVGINKLISAYISEYTQELSGWFEPFDTGYQLQKYNRGDGFYTQHCDGGAFAAYPLYQRVLGIVMYLNTVNEGGGTRFPLHDYTVKPIKGRAAAFPANFTHPHIAEVPISDDKYIVSTFAMSYVLDSTGQRVPMDEFGHEIKY